MMSPVHPEDPTLKRPDSYKVTIINIAYAQNQKHLFIYCLSKMASITQNVFNIAKSYVNVSIQAHPR